MKKILLFLAMTLFLAIPSSVLAQVNLDFTINIEDKIYYPNEKILANISILNRDLNFAAKDTILTVIISDRTYDFKIGDIKPGRSFTKEITLPEFTPGSYTIKGTLNYSGFFEGRDIVETYNGFEVRFPEIVRYPRNVNVIGFNLPDKLIAGKNYNVSVVIKNEGDVGGDMIIEVASLEEFEDEEAYLGSGETKIVNLNINFKNTEVSLIEARVYALINGERYLLVYSGKKAYIEPERIAKLSLDKVELFDESDNEINQNDEVKLKIYIKNSGNYPAANTEGTLKSSNANINILKPNANYSLIQNGESIANSDSFNLKTKDASVGNYNLILELSYEDSDRHLISFSIPVSTSSGGDRCLKNNDCADSETCVENKCRTIPCECGYVKEHKCVRYECCSDSECDTECDKKLHICKPPQCISDSNCKDNQVCNNGKCKDAFTLVFVPIGFEANEYEKFKKIVENHPLNDFLGKTPFKECNNRNVRVHYIEPKNCPVQECNDHCTDCIEKARECVTWNGLGGVYDKFATVTKFSIGGGCAGNIPNDGSSTDASYPEAVIHEIGHTLGLCHVPLCGAKCGLEVEKCSWCPNYKDILNPSQNDIMSYCGLDERFGTSAYDYLKFEYDGLTPKSGGLAKWLNTC